MPIFSTLQDYEISDGEDEKESDIKDLEFRLSHNLQQLQVMILINVMNG